MGRNHTVIAVQDEDHCIWDDGVQWRCCRRSGNRWKFDAFCITLSGLKDFLTRRYSVQRDHGWMPLHHWPVGLVLPKCHGGVP